MNKELLRYLSIAEAISLLLHPHAEVVIHDLATNTIAAIFNSFSKRSVGDASLLQEMEHFSSAGDIFPPYAKTNWDGRKLKSVSATLRDSQNHPIGLLCINLDLTPLEEMQHFIKDWLATTPSLLNSELLFKEDWRERINAYVSHYLKERCISIKMLDKAMKKELVQLLNQAGAFKAKNAASYAADILGISRATLYNYLKNNDVT